MQPRIEQLSGLHLIGQKVEMNMVHNRTKELWQGFMPRRAEIKESLRTALYSVEIYKDTTYFENFNPATLFEKWAAVSVSAGAIAPEAMEVLKIPEGLYAVFHYKGLSQDAAKMYQYIYGQWMPNADYTTDDRPHFAIMGAKYKNNDPDSEEELWVPIKKR